MSTVAPPKVDIIVHLEYFLFHSRSPSLYLHIYLMSHLSLPLFLCIFIGVWKYWREMGCKKKSQFSFKLTMTLGTILLFLIEAHMHTIRKELIECTMYMPCTSHRPGRARQSNGTHPTDTHNHYSDAKFFFFCYSLLLWRIVFFFIVTQFC